MKVLVVGAAGMLGSALLENLGVKAVGCDLPGFDVSDFNSVSIEVNKVKPDVIINTSALTDVDFCERNPEAAEKVHHEGVKNLTETGCRLITVSTDQVFSNSENNSYLLESDPTNPVNVYAASKLRGEIAALRRSNNTVVRTSWLFGVKGLLPWIVTKLLKHQVVTAVTDQTACITSVASLAKILVDMALDEDKTGLYHCVNKGAITPYDLACIVKQRLELVSGTEVGIVRPTQWAKLDLPAARPTWSALSTEKNIVLPPLEEVLELCLQKML